MAWCGVMIFDLIVVVMTLVRTIQINRRSGKDRTLTHVLIRDGKHTYRESFPSDTEMAVKVSSTLGTPYSPRLSATGR